MMVVLPIGCGKPYNSSSSDAEKYGVTAVGTTNFQTMMKVVTNKCVSCHQAYGNYGEAEFVSNGLVVARSLSGSKLYYKIRGNKTAVAGNMPPSESLSTEEINTFETWIMGIN